tara:strand:- start:272 stop:439 length:168 start_codon:yes stop_codon:yes gene_type:complete
VIPARKAKMLRCLLNGMASKLRPEIMHDSKALRTLDAIEYGASMPTVHNQTFHDN